MPTIDGKRFRGACDNCGEPISNYDGVCWQCHVERKRALALENEEQTRQNTLKSKLNWYYNHHEAAVANSHKWKEENKDKIRQYEKDHAVERQAHTETRRVRLFNANQFGFGAQEWKLMIKLYKNQCAYCLETFEVLEQDHVVPLSKGGSHSWDNVVPACKPCNRKKHLKIGEVKHPTFQVICNNLETFESLKEIP
jgi:5-methylcytosine-specific restriction endonuclease McrA